MFVLLSTVGTYGEQSATRYCMAVKNVVVSGNLFKDSRYYLLLKYFYFQLCAANFCTRCSQFCMSQVFFNACSTDEVLDDTEEEIPELDPRETVLHDPPISPEDKLMSQWFCFVQTEDGKIVAVQHPSKENTEVVNFKKNIAAAFQANFKGTADEVEEDTMSLHHSYYRFVLCGTTSP